MPSGQNVTVEVVKLCHLNIWICLYDEFNINVQIHLLSSNKLPEKGKAENALQVVSEDINYFMCNSIFL